MKLFNEGQKLTLFFQKGSNMVEITCAVEKIMDDRLDLALPQYFMRYVEYLKVGRKLTAKAFTKFGTVDFNTVVIYSPLEECFTIEMDYNSLRLTPGKELPLVKAVEDLEIIMPDGKLELKTFELTTDYLKFTYDGKLELNQNITGDLKLPKDYGIINFKAVISEIDPIYENEYTATYIMMTEMDRQTLLYYMYMYAKDTDWE